MWVSVPWFFLSLGPCRVLLVWEGVQEAQATVCSRPGWRGAAGGRSSPLLRRKAIVTSGLERKRALLPSLCWQQQGHASSCLPFSLEVSRRLVALFSQNQVQLPKSAECL